MAGTDPDGQVPQRRWDMFAGFDASGSRAGDVAFDVDVDRRFVLAHGRSPVPVVVTECADGAHWGWLRDGDDAPIMIQPHETLFTMQFPYGPAVEEQRGKGRILRLHVERLDDPALTVHART